MSTTPATERTAFEQLLYLLDATERNIVSFYASSASVIQAIENVDQIDQLLQALQDRELNLQAEQSRAEGLQQRLIKNAPKVVPLVQRSGQLERLAASPSWQLIRESFARQRQQRWRRALITFGAVGGIGLLLFVVLPWLFPVAPRANVVAVEQLVESGDLDGALARAQAEQQRVPTDVDALVWIGALQQRRGDQAAADAAWSEARRLAGEDEFFYSKRSVVLLQLGAFAGAEADARELIKHPTSAAMGQYTLGQIYQRQSKIPEAYSAFQEAARLADETGNATIAVAARMESQSLLQQGAPQPSP